MARVLVSTIALLMAGLHSAPAQKVEWKDFETAVALAQKKPRHIFIDVYTSWCGWCKVLDRETFAHPTVSKYLNEKFYPVKLDAETRDTIVFQNKPHFYLARYKANLLALRLLDGKMLYPSMVILDPQFNRLMIIQGFKKPDQLMPYLIYYGEGYYKKMDFRTFKKEVYSKHDQRL